MMDKDVANYILTVLHSAPLEVRGGELAKLAEIHARAVGQVEEIGGLVEKDGD